MKRPLQLALAATLSFASIAGAQGTTLASDEGILVLSRGDAVIGREAFRVVRGGNSAALYTLSATISYGSHRLSPTLSADASGTPLLYQAEVRRGASVTEQLQATGRPGRLSAVIRRPGGESAREYVLGGRSLVLDDEVYHQYALVALAKPGAVTLVSPRKGSQQSARIEDRGEETITIDRAPVTASHWAVIAADGTRDVWLDASGHLLRVDAGGVVATREERPR